jgi:Fe-S-cluster-containing hydrogenase component 2
MTLKVESLKCTGCRICEFACNYHHDDSISPIGASLMFYYEEKKNYYGMMVKREKSLYLGRPEGEQTLKPGEQIEGAGASAKPILLRIACDLCEEEENGPLCVQACPYGVLSMEGE